MSARVPAAEVHLRAVTADDLGEVAAVHARAFPGSALTRLGPESVRRYYLWQLVGPHQHRFAVALGDHAIAGFCVSGLSRGALGGFVRRNRLFLLCQLALRPWLLTSPMLRERVNTALRALGMKRGPTPQLATMPRGPSWGVLAIAVDPFVQGRGVAKALMDDAEREAAGSGFRHMHLTVATDNHRAVRFYEKIGWHKVVTARGWEGSMEKSLEGGADA